MHPNRIGVQLYAVLSFFSNNMHNAKCKLLSTEMQFKYKERNACMHVECR